MAIFHICFWYKLSAHSDLTGKVSYHLNYQLGGSSNCMDHGRSVILEAIFIYLDSVSLISFGIDFFMVCEPKHMNLAPLITDLLQLLNALPTILCSY